MGGLLKARKYKVRLNALKNNRNITTPSNSFIGQEGCCEIHQELGYKINLVNEKQKFDIKNFRNGGKTLKVGLSFKRKEKTAKDRDFVQLF